MDDIEFAKNGSGVGGQDHLLEVVDDDLVAAVWSQRGLDRRRYGATSVDVAQDGSIFGIIARIKQSTLACIALLTEQGVQGGKEDALAYLL